MSLTSNNPPESSSSRHHSYSRKQKSLGLLCTNFLSLYNREGVHVIGLDDAASKLGVERRRIYDIVNVLESVGVLARKAKNQYTWKGFRGIPTALEELKKEGLRENYNTCDMNSNTVVKVLEDDDGDDEDDSDSNPNTGSQNENSIPTGIAKSTAASRFDNRKEKSLGLLTQNFVKLFLCSNVDLISLDDAARLLLGDAHNSSIMRTKVRRLYDIANVLSSIKLIEKTHTSDTRKPAFRWLGLREKLENALGGASASNEFRKRAFGADVTNISFKRNKVDPPVDGNKVLNLKTENRLKFDNMVTFSDKNNSDSQDSHPGSRTYQFGPFAPVSVSKFGASENKRTSQVHDWENLATTYQPQYHNQALRDLFAHYMEAWQSWYTEVAGKKKIQQIS